MNNKQDDKMERILAMAALAASLELMKKNVDGIYSTTFVEAVTKFNVAVKDELRLFVEAEALDRREI